MVRIYIEGKDRPKIIKFRGKAKNLLKKLEILSEEAIILCNGEIVTEDYEIKDEDSVKILFVISGG